MVRVIKFKAQVSHYDTCINPVDGWVKGYLLYPKYLPSK